MRCVFGDELALVVTDRLVHGGGRDVEAVLERAVLFRPALERVEVGPFPERGRALVLRAGSNVSCKPREHICEAIEIS